MRRKGIDDMNVLEIVGLRPYSSDFDGATYTGYTLHCRVVDFGKQKDAHGTGVTKVSVKQAVYDMLAKGREPDELIGLEIVAFYDQYKKVSMLQEVA